jgi:hypothetical protein
MGGNIFATLVAVFGQLCKHPGCGSFGLLGSSPGLLCPLDRKLNVLLGDRLTAGVFQFGSAAFVNPDLRSSHRGDSSITRC